MARFNLNAWIVEQQGRHYCHCGCGQAIRILREHHARGIPRFLAGHVSRVRNAMRGRFGSDNPHFRGGRFLDQNGYVFVLNPNRTCHSDRYIYEHRLVMTRHLGRPLSSDEQVHHRNGNKADNCLTNLELIGAANHATLHEDILRRQLGEAVYLQIKRGIHQGIPYREMIACSEL